MASRNRRRLGIAGAVAGLGAAGVGAAVGTRRFVVGRRRFHPDPEAEEPFGRLRGRPLTVLADDGLPLHVEIDEQPGEGVPLTVVFCHGYTLNQDMWHYQRRDLTRGMPPGSPPMRLVFWDQRSHGRSGRSRPAHATIDQTGADLHAVLRATTGPDDPVVLVGHSMGGMSVMALADGYPELFGARVVGVALINTSEGLLAEVTLGLPMALARLVQPLTPGVLRGLGSRPRLVERGRALGADVAFMVTRRMAFADKYVSPAVVDLLEQMIRATPIDVIAEFYPALMSHDKAAALAVIGRVPTLVMVGDRDLLTPLAHGRRLAGALPDCELIEVEEAGHVLPLEHPGMVTGGLRRLVERVRPAVAERSTRADRRRA
ncbi:Pimeloyl-ACP methyl ester carboxylesterase [Thermomonospora echinospora]|uniref:Pimeloyl-ACP methyl ester carboxylesterase n=1 Tax=Thermomonospora echinospora TaxID=1992 RepID=A0A1H5ZE65_9ACTN|nr:alpha/beta hydrolase [Thermomonospora echinospora]SEG33666.1 Pimeloyl-ACP methyl ester carboxylesterase [Thermomonospora echinospora]